MVPLTPAQVTPRLAALFKPNMPASLRCFAVLAGNSAGLILTDDPSHPTWGVVQEIGDGTIYKGHKLLAWSKKER